MTTLDMRKFGWVMAVKADMNLVKKTRNYILVMKVWEDMKKNIKFTISYDGSRFLGWQRLHGENRKLSIQGILEDMLFKVTGQKVKLVGSGRTDKGVHAYGQVANAFFDASKKSEEFIDFEKTYLSCCKNVGKEECCDIKRKLKCFRILCNMHLPEDIRITDIKVVDKNFHSRFSAKSKTYEYHLSLGETPCVFERKYALHVSEPLDVEQMKKAADLLVGTHDFGTFCTRAEEKEDTVRTIYKIELIEEDRKLILRYQGDGFLYNMVRILSGTLLEVGLRERSAESVLKALEERNRQLAGKTLSSVGLFLVKVEY